MSKPKTTTVVLKEATIYLLYEGYHYQGYHDDGMDHGYHKGTGRPHWEPSHNHYMFRGAASNRSSLQKLIQRTRKFPKENQGHLVYFKGKALKGGKNLYLPRTGGFVEIELTNLKYGSPPGTLEKLRGKSPQYPIAESPELPLSAFVTWEK